VGDADDTGSIPELSALAFSIRYCIHDELPGKRPQVRLPSLYSTTSPPPSVGAAIGATDAVNVEGSFGWHAKKEGDPRLGEACRNTATLMSFTVWHLGCSSSAMNRLGIWAWRRQEFQMVPAIACPAHRQGASDGAWVVAKPRSSQRVASSHRSNFAGDAAFPRSFATVIPG
jgi:hypothetical protein